MKVVVTGGAGFIGAHLSDACAAAGEDVLVIDDLSNGDASLVPPERLLKLDISDVAADLVSAFDGAEVVYHLAAHRAVLRSVDDPVATDRANTGGTINVLDAARQAGVRRVVVTSSSSVYGGAEQLPTPETAELCPRSPYAVSKVAAEHYARVFWEIYGLETVSLRPFNVYGPRQPVEGRYALAVPAFISAAAERRPPEIYGDGHQSRDFTYVDDAVAAFRRAASADDSVCGRAFNIGGGRSISLLDLWEELGRITGPLPDPVFSDPRPGDVRRTEADISQAGTDLGWQPNVPLSEGLRRSLEWRTAHAGAR